MFLNSYEPMDEIEFDYAIIDLNLNADYFSDVKDKLISLAPDYAKKTENSFPYLLRINQLDSVFYNKIKESDKVKVKQGINPFFLFMFKSIPTREPDIFNHLKNILVYVRNEKKYLYRYYDPRVWMLLNFFESTDFFEINKYFRNIKIGFMGDYFFFENKAKNAVTSSIDFAFVDEVSMCNNVLILLNEDIGFERYIEKINKIFFYIKFCKKNNVKNKKDIVSIVFHTLLLGDEYVNTGLFRKMKNSIKGYETESKLLSSKEWMIFFDEYKVFDNDLRSKVMYDY